MIDLSVKDIDLEDASKKRKFTIFKKQNSQKIIDWQKTHKSIPPIMWIEKEKEFVWLDRPTRRRMERSAK